MADFTRKPTVSRMAFRGMKLNAAPDALPDGKFTYAQNIRGYNIDQITSRFPWLNLTPVPTSPNLPGIVTTLEPALGLYKIIPGNTLASGAIYLGGVSILTGLSRFGCSLIPFRPNESPSAWEYVFDSLKQSKILPNPASPSSSIIKKVGIAEPQLPCDAYFGTRYENILGTFFAAAGFTASGTASGLADTNRAIDTAGVVLNDPVFSTYPGVCSVQVSPSVNYQRDMIVSINLFLFRVVDVFPAAFTGIKISSIFYFSGTTGHCIIVPQNINAGAGDPGVGISENAVLGSLRRGSIIYIPAQNIYCYVWSVTEGPDGSVCIETSTSVQVFVGNTLNAISAIQVQNGQLPVQPVIGQNIAPAAVKFQVTAGIGSVKANVSSFAPIFALQNYSFQQEDYLHLSVLVDNPNNLISCRIGLDVSDGTFTSDYYYYEIRPSDLQTANTGSASSQITQLAASQLVGQRASIDAQQDTAYNNEIYSNSGSQLLIGGGNAVWTEIVIPISKLIRVGSNDNLTLANTGWFAFSANASGTVEMAFAGFCVYGGGQPDTGTSIPYQYRYRYRDSQTGAASNWSPVTRYAFTAERTQGAIIIPQQTTDPQADTYDIERQGGALEEFTYIGSALIAQPSASNPTLFTDNYGDDQVANNEELPEDNYEPFPSIGPPVSTTTTGANLTGFVAILVFPTSPSNATLLQFGNLLPGNQIQVGQQVYTTYSRPLQIATGVGTVTYLVYLQENAGGIVNAQATILEPALANQMLNAVWGPDDNGCLFAVGDTLRPGGVYNTNPNNPDSSNEGVNFNELCAPIEPLINGALIQQTSCVASSIRWWAGRSGQDALGNLKYNWIEIPVGRGLAAIYGICTDGDNIYFVGKDGIYMHSGGPASSLTDDDLYPIFPHEGVVPGFPPNNITYNGNTVYAPAYQFSQNFRLAVVNRFLYFTYQDQGGNYHTLACDLRTKAWTVDISAAGTAALSVYAGTPAPPSEAVNTLIPQLYAGDGAGAIWITNNTASPASENIACIVCTREEIGDDVRASKLFGDAMADLIPGAVVTVTPITLGAAQTPATLGPSSSRLPGTPIDIGGELLAQSLGLQLSWTDTGGQVTLFSWQVSWIPQPENTARRFTDWDGGPGNRNLFFQGFELEADTANAVKGIKVRDADALALHDFNGPTALLNQIQHNGQQTLPYSFVTPFQAHLVRLEPQDSVIWRMFRIRWITRPTPDSALNWITQATSYGIPGYHHVHHSLFAYASTQPVTLTIKTDGNTNTYTLPSTGGAYKKALIMFNPVKGLVDLWSAVSAAAFQVWQDDIEIFVKGWGDPGPYNKARILGAPMIPDADI